MDGLGKDYFERFSACEPRFLYYPLDFNTYLNICSADI